VVEGKGRAHRCGWRACASEAVYVWHQVRRGRKVAPEHGVLQMLGDSPPRPQTCGRPGVGEEGRCTACICCGICC
jgi:hypothetical protein